MTCNLQTRPIGSKYSGRNVCSVSLCTCTKSENETISTISIIIIIAEDKNAENETVTPEPVKGVAKSEEARPLPLIMNRSNSKYIYNYIYIYVYIYTYIYTHACIWWPSKIILEEKVNMFNQRRAPVVMCSPTEVAVPLWIGVLGCLVLSTTPTTRAVMARKPR